MPSLIIHGHFYQPPRENPWTGIVEEQPSAAPFHDWNERIHSECYRPNGWAMIADLTSGESRTINNYENISFNFGPTLLTWLQSYHPDTYARIISADHESIKKRGGHGNAIAQAYGHAILPLCNQRDLRTQIRWGLADFRHRFARDAEAIWLPETACNYTVMDALIDQGLRFVILAPHQAARVRSVKMPIGRDSDEDLNDDWRDVTDQSIDTSIPYAYLHRDAPERSIAVFFYDGVTSRAIAFEHLLQSSQELANAFARSSAGKEMINVATDGETYGHHYKFGDICLAHALTVETPRRNLHATNYGEYLDAHPPLFEVQINNGPDSEGTSWSCPHGVGRWIRDCGCQTGGQLGWNQAWRTPLRQALDFLRDENEKHFETTRGRLFTDPWQARDDSIVLILEPNHSRERFLFEQTGQWLSAGQQQRALTYLELQRMLILLYTSCGWFFSDIGGIETIQVLSYAARAIDLMKQLNLPSVRERFLEILAEGRSNRTELGTGADIYREFVEPLKAAAVPKQVIA